MAEQERSLAVVPPRGTPSLPVEIALHQMGRVKEPPPHFDPPGPDWVKAYHQPKKRVALERGGSAARPEVPEEDEQSELRSILMRLQQTARPAQAKPEPVVLYAEAEEKPQRKKYTPSTPALDSSTRVNHMKCVVRTCLAIEETSMKTVSSDEKGVDFLCDWMTQLSTQLIEHIREAGEIFKQRETWSILAKIASGILAAISLLFGISLVATPAGGMLVGGLLIASGLLSIVNLILEETKVWDWVANQIAGDDKKLSDQLKVWIPAGVGMLSALVGSAGSVAALFMEAFNMVQQMLLVGKTVTDIAKHISSMAEGVATSESIKSQAESEHIQTQIDMSDGNLRGALDRLKQVGGMVHRSISSAHRMIANSTKAAQMAEIQG